MANAGKQCKVHYIGTLDDGTKFDSSYDRNEPIEFVCMAHQMIPGFDAAVNEMTVGETRKVHIPCKDAYGKRDPRAIQKAPISIVPEGFNPHVGDKVMLNSPYGPMPAVIAALDDQFITFDMNHEMAGKDLNFEITLLEVTDAPAGGCDCGCDDCSDGCC